MWKQFFIRLQAKRRRLNARWQERCARRRWLKREKHRRKVEQVSFSLQHVLSSDAEVQPT
jgi:hypothetical protein